MPYGNLPQLISSLTYTEEGINYLFGESNGLSKMFNKINKNNNPFKDLSLFFIYIVFSTEVTKLFYSMRYFFN